MNNADYTTLAVVIEVAVILAIISLCAVVDPYLRRREQ